MRQYIFTERERKILKAWLNDDNKLKDFRVLKHQIIIGTSKIQQDYELLQKAFQSFSKEES